MTLSSTNAHFWLRLYVPVYYEAFLLFSFLLLSFDNSDYQRNGDYFPTRLNVQKDGINLVCLTKVRSNPENNVGLMTISKYTNKINKIFEIFNIIHFVYSTVEVLATLTSDVGRIFSKMHLIQPKGEINVLTGIRIAHVSYWMQLESLKYIISLYSWFLSIDRVKITRCVLWYLWVHL